MKLQLCLIAQERAGLATGLAHATTSGSEPKPKVEISASCSSLSLPPPGPGFHEWKVVETQLLVELEHPLKWLTHQESDAEILL